MAPATGRRSSSELDAAVAAPSGETCDSTMNPARRRLAELSITLRNPWCRLIFSSQLISGLGDWGGRLALAVVVYDRSSSAALAAASTAISLLPWLGPGQLLSTLSDRYGNVRVMIAADLARAAAFVAMSLVAGVVPLLVLAFVAGLGVPPFEGSKASALVEVTETRSYGAAVAVHSMVNQTEILVGYALGGLLITLVGAEATLALNALTFLVSAAILTRLLRSPAATARSLAKRGWAGVRAGAEPWRRDPVCRRALLLFIGTSMLSVLPEALVVPFADEIGLGDAYVGVLAALIAVGSFVGAVVAPTNGSPEAILRATALRGAAAALLAGAVFVLSSSVLASAIAYAITGLVDAVAVPTNIVVGRRLPVAGRATAMTVAMGSQNIVHVVSITVAGGFADATTTRATLIVALLLVVPICLWSALAPIGHGELANQAPTEDDAARWAAH